MLHTPKANFEVIARGGYYGSPTQHEAERAGLQYANNAYSITIQGNCVDVLLFIEKYKRWNPYVKINKGIA